MDENSTNLDVGTHGYVRQTYQGEPEQPRVYVIQDIHAQWEVQKNIRSLIQTLVEKNGITEVGLEGAARLVSVDIFRTLPDSDAVAAALDQALRLGLIGGPERAAFDVPSLSLWGIEDPALYAQHLEVCRRALAERGENQRRVFQRQNHLIDGAAQKCSTPLREFWRRQRCYRAAPSQIAPWISYLWAQRDPSSSFPQIQRWMEAEKIRAHFGKRGTTVSSQEVLRAIEGMSSLGREGFSVPKTEPGKESRQAPPLVEELSRLEEQVERRLAKPLSDRQWLYGWKESERNQKLASLQLTPNEWRDYVNNTMEKGVQRAKTHRLQSSGANDPVLADGDDSLAWNRLFYDYAFRRDESLARGIMDLARRSRSGSVACVVGGFHVEGLVHHLRKEGISYTVILPRASSRLDIPAPPLAELINPPTRLGRVLAGLDIALNSPRLTCRDDSWLNAVPQIRQEVFLARHRLGRLVVGMVGIKHLLHGGRALDWTIFDPLRQGGFLPEHGDVATAIHGSLALVRLGQGPRCVIIAAEVDSTLGRFQEQSGDSTSSAIPRADSFASLFGDQQPVARQPWAVDGKTVTLHYYVGDFLKNVEFTSLEIKSHKNLVQFFADFKGLRSLLYRVQSHARWGDPARLKWGARSPHPGPAVVIGDADADVHQMMKVLKSEKLVDNKGHWIGGRRIVVQVGDVIGRGKHPRELYDLLFRIQDEARWAGGEFLLLLGNHEMQLMMGKPIENDIKDKLTPEEVKNLRNTLIQNTLDGKLQASAVIESPQGDPYLVTHAGYSQSLNKSISRSLAWTHFKATRREVPLSPETDPQFISAFFNDSAQFVAGFLKKNPDTNPKGEDLYEYLGPSGIFHGSQGIFTRVAKEIDGDWAPGMRQIIGHSVASFVRYQDNNEQVINTDGGFFRKVNGSPRPLNPMYLRIDANSIPRAIEIGRFGERRIYQLPSGIQTPIPDNIWAKMVDVKDRATLAFYPIAWLKKHILHSNTIPDLVRVYKRFYDVLGEGRFPWTRRARPRLWMESQKMLVEALCEQRASRETVQNDSLPLQVIQGYEDRLDNLLFQAQDVWQSLEPSLKNVFFTAFLAGHDWNPLKESKREEPSVVHGVAPLQIRPLSVPGVHEIVVHSQIDRPGLLADIAGVIAAHGYNILAADARTEEGRVVDRFAIQGFPEGSDNMEKVQERMNGDLIDIFHSELSIEGLFERNERSYTFSRTPRAHHPSTVVQWQGEQLYVLTPDREEPGLLHLIARKLAELQCNITLAPNSIRTQGYAVYDFFHVTENDGQALSAQRKIKVAEELTLFLGMDAISSADFGPSPAEHTGSFWRWLTRILPRRNGVGEWFNLPAHAQNLVAMDKGGFVTRPALGQPGDRIPLEHVTVVSNEVLSFLGENPDVPPKVNQMWAGVFRSERPSIDEIQGFGKMVAQEVNPMEEQRESDGLISSQILCAVFLLADKVEAKDWNVAFENFRRGFNTNLFVMGETVPVESRGERRVAFEITPSMLSGNMTPEDDTRLNELHALIQSGRSHSLHMIWILPSDEVSLDDFLDGHFPDRAGSLTSTVIIKDQLTKPIFYWEEEQGNPRQYSVQRLWEEIRGLDQDSAEPLDLYVTRRDEWVLESEVEKQVRILVCLPGGLVADATQPIGVALRRIVYLKSNA